jgi:hydroxymethylpyrimidine pyrophosphatase-like HAD family hydrolase
MPPPSPLDAIICDIDGCLSPEHIGPADLPSLQIVADHNRRAAAGLAPPLTLCTGRPLPFADAVARMVGAVRTPIVCEAGAWLFDPVAYRWELDPRITPAHRALIAQVRDWAAGAFDSVWFEEGKAAAVTVFHQRGADELRERVLPVVRQRIAAESWPLRASMTWTCINIELDFISKATGLDRLFARTGFAPERLAGIGDTMSDLAIRQRVAYFACPANAADELKPHADYIARAPEAAGVAEILGVLCPRP